MRVLLISFVIACGAPPARPLAVGAPPAPRADARPVDPVRIEIPAGIRSLDTDGVHVAILTFDDELVGVSLHGDRLYRKRAGKLGGSAGVRIIDGVAIVASHERVVAFDAKTGARRWRRVVEGSDMFSTQIHGSAVWIDGDGSSFTLDARTGSDVARVVPQARALKIDTTHVADHRYELFATTGGKELWRLTIDSPWVRATTHVELGDTVVFARAVGEASTLVALDARTGTERYTRALADNDSLRYAFAGPRFSWFWILDGAAMGTGQGGDKLVAISPAGDVLRELSLPTPDTRYCGIDVKAASTAGVLVVAHGARKHRRRGECAMPVVDIHVPVSRTATTGSSRVPRT